MILLPRHLVPRATVSVVTLCNLPQNQSMGSYTKINKRVQLTGGDHLYIGSYTFPYGADRMGGPKEPFYAYVRIPL